MRIHNPLPQVLGRPWGLLSGHLSSGTRPRAPASLTNRTVISCGLGAHGLGGMASREEGGPQSPGKMGYRSGGSQQGSSKDAPGRKAVLDASTRLASHSFIV